MESDPYQHPEEEKGRTYPVLELKVIRSPNFQSVYSNNASATNTFQDLQLVFSHITKIREEDPCIEDLVRITLSWEHALLLRSLLDRMVKGYEETHGPIRVESRSETKRPGRP